MAISAGAVVRPLLAQVMTCANGTVAIRSNRNRSWYFFRRFSGSQ